MSKESIVSAAKSAFVVAQDSAIEKVFGDVVDQAQSEVGPSGVPQEQVDAKIAEALAAQKAQFDADFAADEAADAEELAKAHADADAAFAELHVQIEDLAAGKKKADAVVANLKASAAKLQAVLDALKEVNLPEEEPAQG